MTKLVPMSDLAADDLMLDLVGLRRQAGDDPLAGLLAAVAAHADHPMLSAPGARRGGRHRFLSAFAALVVGASGAGVAAAVTIPHGGPSSSAGRQAPERDTHTNGLGVRTESRIGAPGSGRIVMLAPDGALVVVAPAAAPYGPAELAGVSAVLAAGALTPTRSSGPDGSLTLSPQRGGSPVRASQPAGQVDPAPTQDPVSTGNKANDPPAEDEDTGNGSDDTTVSPTKPKAKTDPTAPTQDLALVDQNLDVRGRGDKPAKGHGSTGPTPPADAQDQPGAGPGAGPNPQPNAGAQPNSGAQPNPGPQPKPASGQQGHEDPQVDQDGRDVPAADPTGVVRPADGAGTVAQTPETADAEGDVVSEAPRDASEDVSEDVSEDLGTDVAPAVAQEAADGQG